MKRKDARENAFKVLFEISFSEDADVDETMTLAAANGQIDIFNPATE